MTFSDASVGGVGYAADIIESTPGGSGTPGVALTPDKFVPLLDQAVKGVWEMVDTPVMRGTRFTKAILERAHLKVAGPVSYMANPTEGLEYPLAALGATSALSLGTPAALTAPAVTAAGVTTITAPGAWDTMAGQFIYINCTSLGVQQVNTEVRLVSPTSTNGSLVVAQLLKNPALTSGAFVCVAAQDKYANSLLGSAYLNMLPTITYESNKGRQWAWRWPGIYVDKLSFDFTKSEAKMTAELMGSADPIYCNAGTSPAMVDYNPVLAEEINALRPLTGIDGFIMTGGDPDASGASTLRAALGVQNVKLDFMNNCLEEAVFNGQHTYMVFPSDKAECTVEYGEIATAKRPDVWLDYIAASKSTSFLAQSVKNYGTASAPNFGGLGFYIPTFRFRDDESSEKIGSVNVFNRKGMALAPPGGAQDYLQVYRLKPS